MIAEKLKQARLDARLTQQQLAEKVGIKQAHISRYEKGVYVPKLDKLVLIAKATNKPLEYFISNDE